VEAVDRRADDFQIAEARRQLVREAGLARAVDAVDPDEGDSRRDAGSDLGRDAAQEGRTVAATRVYRNL